MKFVLLTYESGISNLKGINSGGYEFGMNFPLPFFQPRNEWYSVCVFKDRNFITLCNEFQGVFLSVYRAWISDDRWMNFEVCFFICLQGMNFWWQIVEFWGVFLTCLQGMNFQWQMLNFEACFLSVYGGVNFWQYFSLSHTFQRNPQESAGQQEFQRNEPEFRRNSLK